MTPKQAAEKVLRYQRTQKISDGEVDALLTAMWSLLEKAISREDIRPLLKK